MRIDGSIPLRTTIPARLPQPAGRPAHQPASPATTTAEPPRGAAEAALWSVLTADERAFFDQQAARGPLTYDATTAVRVDSAPRGNRLDIVG